MSLCRVSTPLLMLWASEPSMTLWYESFGPAPSVCSNGCQLILSFTQQIIQPLNNHHVCPYGIDLRPWLFWEAAARWSVWSVLLRGTTDTRCAVWRSRSPVTRMQTTGDSSCVSISGNISSCVPARGQVSMIDEWTRLCHIREVELFM